MPAYLQLAPAPAASQTVLEAERPIRVVLAENHAAMRRSLRLLLDDEAELQVVAQAGDLATAMCHVERHRPRVLVLDLGMHNGSSIKVISRLRHQLPDVEIVVLTMKESPAFAQRAIDAGAVGFVLKDRADSELPDAVRSAARGAEYVSVLVRPGLNSLRQNIRDQGLTPSKPKVVRLAAADRKSIAGTDELGPAR